MNHDQTVKVQYFGIILSKIFEKECRRLLAGDMLQPVNQSTKRGSHRRNIISQLQLIDIQLIWHE